MISRICLICYDISSNKTRREIVKLLSDYGKRVQESVFLCNLSIERVKNLDKDLRAFYARKKHGLRGVAKAGAVNARTPPDQGGKKKPSARPIVSKGSAEQTSKPKKNDTNLNNTLDILMVTVEPGVINAALVLGNPIDANRPFAVI